MTAKAMTERLPDFCCAPTVLRKTGETVIQCPCCRNAHNNACGGHSHAHCELENEQNIMMTNGRDFIPNHGHNICDCEVVNDRCELLGNERPLKEILTPHLPPAQSDSDMEEDTPWSG